MHIVPLSPANEARWDAFLPQSVQGVFLHSRRFLAYHRNRFEDLSLLLEDDRGRLRAVFPAARSPASETEVVSHPGLTYGGLLHDPACRADEVQAMVVGVCDWYREQRLTSLLYKAPPAHIASRLVQSDLYAWWRQGAQLVRRDLWNVLDLRQPRKSSKGHRWSCKKASDQGLAVSKLDLDEFDAFHHMLATSLQEQHGVEPVHTRDQLIDLQQRFPDHIQLWGCHTPENKLIAAALLFRLRPGCWHTQYITANSTGRELFASDLLLEELIKLATDARVDYFSFGCSTDHDGRSLNAGLYSFKAGMGSGSSVHDFYRLEL